MSFETFINYIESLRNYSDRTNKLVDALDGGYTYIDEIIGDLGTLVIESVNESPADEFYEEFWNNINYNATESIWKDYYNRLRG